MTKPISSSSSAYAFAPSDSLEEIVVQVEHTWYGKLNEVDPDSREKYRLMVHSMVKQLRADLLRMKHDRKGSSTIRQELQHSIEGYNTILKGFYTNCSVYEGGKTLECETYADVANRLSSSHLGGFEFQLVEEEPSLMDHFTSSLESFSVYLDTAEKLDAKGDPHLAQEQQDVLASLCAINVVGEVFHLAGAVVSAGVKSACSMNETTEKVCESTLNFAKKTGKAAVEVTGTKELVKEGIQFIQSCDGSSIKRVLVDRCKFPEKEADQLAKQQVKSYVGISAGVVGGTATVLVFKGVAKLTRASISLSKKGTAAASARAAPTWNRFGNVLMENKLAMQVNEYIKKSFAKLSAGAVVTFASKGFNKLAKTTASFARKEGASESASQEGSPIRFGSDHLLMPTKLATRVNECAEKRLYFPTVAELQELGLSDLHQIFSTNQETLIGMLGMEPFPRFGFHGTEQNAVMALISSRAPVSDAGNFLWITSFYNRVNPVAQLADIQSMLYKSSLYMGKEFNPTDGIFVLDATTARPYGKSFSFQVAETATDTAVDKRIFNLMARDGTGPLIATGQGRRPLIREDALVNVDEFHITFTRETYDQVVKGYVLRSDSHYPLTGVLNYSNQDAFQLFDRLVRQEFLVNAFEKLKIVDVPNAPWKEYHRTGLELLNLPPEQMLVPLEQLGHVGEYFNGRNSVAKQIFSRREPFHLGNFSPIPSIAKRALTGEEIRLGKDASLVAYVESHGSTMFIQLERLHSPTTPLNPKHTMEEFIRFAKENKAKKLYVEVNPHPNEKLPLPKVESSKPLPGPTDIVLEFTDWIQQFPVVHERIQLIDKWLPSYYAPIFEIPLHAPL